MFTINRLNVLSIPFANGQIHFPQMKERNHPKKNLLRIEIIQTVIQTTSLADFFCSIFKFDLQYKSQKCKHDDISMMTQILCCYHSLSLSNNYGSFFTSMKTNGSLIKLPGYCPSILHVCECICLGASAC